MEVKTLSDLDVIIDRIETITLTIKTRPPQANVVDVTSQCNKLNAVADILTEIAGGSDAACVKAKRKRKAKKFVKEILEAIEDDGDDDLGDTEKPDTPGNGNGDGQGENKDD